MKKIISGALFGISMLFLGVMNYSTTDNVEAFGPCKSKGHETWYGFACDGSGSTECFIKGDCDGSGNPKPKK